MINKNPAFTLIELLIAITVFSIFIAFSMTAFSVFHRVQQDSATSRDVMFQIDDAMNIITEAVKENKIYYDEYDCSNSLGTKTLLTNFDLNISLRANILTAYCLDDYIDPSSLVLISLDGLERIVFTWDSDEESLTMQKFALNDSGDDWDELSDLLKLHSDSVNVTNVDFRIFPKLDPYDFRNNEAEDFYQPNVKVEMTFETPGQAKPSIILDFETTITSRVYQ